MASLQEIIARQVSSNFMNADGKVAGELRTVTSKYPFANGSNPVGIAVARATSLANELLLTGKSADNKERKEHLDALYWELDDAMGNLTCAWDDFTDAAKTFVYLHTQHARAVEALKAFANTKNKKQHERAVERQKKRVRDLSGPLQMLHRQHVNQHPDKVQEKADAVAEYSEEMRDDATELLRESIVCSTVKKGHERWGPVVVKATNEYMEAGRKLRDLLDREEKLQRDVNDTCVRKEKIGRQLRTFGKEHNLARVHSACKMEAIAAFSKALGIKDGVARAKKLTYLNAKSYEQHPDDDYAHACERMRGYVRKIEAAGVTDVVEKVLDAMESYELTGEYKNPIVEREKAEEVGKKLRELEKKVEAVEKKKAVEKERAVEKEKAVGKQEVVEKREKTEQAHEKAEEEEGPESKRKGKGDKKSKGKGKGKKQAMR
ncbi:MAG: hypothetical protein LQ338_007153 [Usnochroma carphineum]|nr:MAG: hypothetical protein LQ338_007153 [Usnochroma carphineum]